MDQKSEKGLTNYDCLKCFSFFFCETKTTAEAMKFSILSYRHLSLK